MLLFIYLPKCANNIATNLKSPNRFWLKRKSPNHHENHAGGDATYKTVYQKTFNPVIHHVASLEL